MNMKLIQALIIALSLTGCAEQASFRMSKDTVRVSTSTAPIYGALEAQKRAMVLAAQETIKNGYDSFIVIGDDHGYSQNLMSQSLRGSVAMPRFSADFMIRMFRSGQPGAENAIDAMEIIRNQA